MIIGTSAGSADWNGGIVDEFRYDNTIWDATEVKQIYHRLSEPDERILQELTQGHFFRRGRDDLTPMLIDYSSGATVPTMGYTGTLTLQGAYHNPLNIVAGVSAT